MGGNAEHAKCGLAELFIFIAALIAGTCCSLCSKVLLGMHGVGLSGEVEPFQNPLFQTFGMFVGMVAALFMHFLVQAFKIPFPGYDHENPEPLPRWMYFLLAIPSLFDLVATALCMFGLLYVNVSIYQMLRGGAIIFVAILKQFVLGHPLKKFMWVGVMWNVVSIILVGATALLSDPPASSDGTVSTGNPLMGVFLVLAGAFVQSLQYAFEEKVMNMDISAPPLFLIGMEGLWGIIICVFFLYPVAYNIPGNDHGSLENPFNTFEMFKNSSEIRSMFTLYFFSIFFYNVLACLVTFMLNSVWHAILDNFRPITVWGTDLFIFYFVTTSFGESWTIYSYVQLLGMFVLLYGTAIYNAPNPGSLKLDGGAASFCLDFTEEYAEIEEEMEDTRLDIEAESSLLGKSYSPKKQSPFLGGVSPFISGSPRTMKRHKELAEHGSGLMQGSGIAMNNRKSYGSVDGK